MAAAKVLDLGFAARAPKYDEYGPDDFKYILVDKIRVPEKRMRRIDWSKGAAKEIIESMERMGRLIDPIAVRHGGDDGVHELVIGVTRFLAAKKLGWEKIECKVVKWSADEIEWHAIVENMARKQMDDKERVKLTTILLNLYGRIFGKDPGRKASGAAAVASVDRSKGGKFKSKAPADDDVSPCPETGEPLNRTVRFNGDDEESLEPDKEPVKSFTTMVSEQTGVSVDTARDDAKIARTFNPDDQDLFATLNVTRADMLKICDVPDKVAQRQVMSLCAAGRSVDEAIKTVLANPENVAKQKAQIKQAELTDEVWLETYCDKFRPGLQDKTAFDIDALAWRHTSSDRGVFRGKIKEIISKARGKRWTPAVHRMAMAAFMMPPDEWVHCRGCYGKNVDNPDCELCRGAGYAVEYKSDYYKAKR